MESLMTPFADSSFSVAEAACVAGLSERAVHQEIDLKIIRLERANGERLMTGTDLLYLGAVKEAAGLPPLKWSSQKYGILP
jgi:hypothetical protein